VGCDSVATLNLTVNSTSSSTTNVTKCSNEFPYSWNGTNYSAAGTYTFTTTNAVGCDSTATLILGVTNSTSDTATVSACETYTWSVNSQTYTTNGTYSVVSGCHTDVLILTISVPQLQQEQITACDSYSWNGNTYTSSGTYTFATACGTESLVLTINNSTHDVDEETKCGSYVWNGTTYTSSGIYVYNYTNGSGCASADTLYLTINPIPTVPGTVTGTSEVCSLVGSSTPSVYATTGVNDAVSYQWTMPIGATLVSGQGTTSIGVTFSNSLATTNQRIQVASVSDQGCLSATSSITLTKMIPNIPAAIIGQTNVCPVMGLDSTLAYAVAPVAGADSYLWTAPNGGQIISGQGSNTVNVKFLSTFSTGSMTCTAVAACGNRSPRSLALTRLIPTSPASISGPNSACAYIGTGVQATYSVAPVTNATGYVWTVPSTVTIVSGQGTTSIVVTFAGNYTTTTIKCRAFNNCLTTGDRQLSVTAATFSAPGPITGPTNACPFINQQDALATYRIRKVPNVTQYVWTVPAGVTIVSRPGIGADDTVINVSFSSSFVYGSQILVRSAGCGLSAARSITINGIVPSAPGMISGPINVCEFMVSASSPNGNIATYTIRKVTGASSYIWTAPANATIIANPGGAGVNDTVIQVKFNSDFNSGNIQVRSNNACGSSSNRSLTVNRLNPAFPATFDVVQTGTCPNRVFTYTLPSMPSNATSVLWTIPAAGVIVSGQGTTSITVSYPPSIVAGNVTAQSINNCSSSSIRSLSVKLTACPSSFAGSGTNPTSKVNLLDANKQDAVVSPNPSHGAFQIATFGFDSNQAFDIRITDQTGKLIRAQRYNNQAGLIRLGEDLMPGIYFLQIAQGDRRVVKKIQKL
ncbi:MAG: T9SS type A sorting domain-containing protein, partial [Ferruginibacter sp.]